MRLERAVFALPLRVALGLWVVLFVGFLGGTMPQIDPTIRVVAEMVGVLPVAAWALFRLRGPRSAIDVAILLALTAHAIVSVTSMDRTGSLDALGMALALALLFWLMREVALGDLSQRMVALAVVIGVTPWLTATAVAWILEKVDWVRAGGGIPNLESYQVFIWGTANVFPVLLLLAIGFATWLPAGLVRRSALTVLVVTAVVVVPFSAGRAGWLAILVALAALEVLSNWPLSRAVAHRLHVRPRTLFASTAIAVALVLATLAIRYGGDPASGFLSRFLLWGEALAIFVTTPLIGAGPSTFSWVRLQHAPDFVDRPAVILTHNVAFQTLADGGVILAVGLIVVLVAWLITVWRARGSLTGRQRATAAVVVGVAASQLLDDFSFVPAVTAMLVTLGAWALPPTPLPSPRPGRFVTPLIALLLAALALPAVVAVVDARLAAAAARSAAVRGDWTASISGFEKAVLAHPTDAGYYLGLAFSFAEAHEPARALSAYAAARQLNPGDPRGAGGLAALTDDRATRRALLSEAARHSNDPQYAYRLALDLAEDDPAGAARWMAHAVVLEPQLVGLIGKYAPKISVDRVIAEVPSVASATGSIKGEDPQIAVWNAGLYAQQLPPTAPASWQAIAAAAAGRLDAAGTALSRAKDDEPYLARTYQAAMAVDLFRCDAAAYQRDRVLEELGANSYAAPTNAVEVDFRDGVYREPGLGDYQPSNAARLPVVPRWPTALVDVPACESIP
jgi:O-antigen ligase/tetratricopeptide (TPR) repeat protein